MSETGESRLFNIMVLAVAGLFAGLSIANIIYYTRVKRGTNCNVTTGEANAMVWINAILLFFSGIIFLWALWKLLFSREYRQQLTQSVSTYLQSPSTGVFGTTQNGMPIYVTGGPTPGSVAGPVASPVVAPAPAPGTVTVTAPVSTVAPQTQSMSVPLAATKGLPYRGY